MNLFDDNLAGYLENHSSPENELLKQINRETHLKEPRAHMLSGHYQGRVLSLISKMKSPKRIIEVGTFTGYATLCLAEGLNSDGIIHTIDINEELEERVQGYFNDSIYADQIKYHIGDAIDIIPTLHDSFDMAFIDADKKNNFNYYELILDKMPSGGVILIDNVLWKGKVLEDTPDKQTEIILELNEKIAADERVEKVILPIRDGLFLIRKL
ncbi:O-methyltransferase [Albibacterium bauzanense]|uniref:Putative O-methyltransferase YrrM n=1 Tax=Albibacterium bauzanense TaxID=653929 RepID=A0A4R1LVR6_9SPHI|nr:class I SAM-dependent methyltransferase [Albibacterium bauzanense]TCK83185.1 putative O-methyltransferase YrrM [Albibacterium bauzanense]